MFSANRNVICEGTPHAGSKRQIRECKAAIGFVEKDARQRELTASDRAPFSARYAARAWFETAPALLLKDAPGSGVKLETGVLSERAWVESAVEPVFVTREEISGPAFTPAAPLPGAIGQLIEKIFIADGLERDAIARAFQTQARHIPAWGSRQCSQ